MQLVIEAFNLEHAVFCLQNSCDHLILGQTNYCSRLAHDFSRDQIQALISQKKNTKIWIKVNAFFVEQQLDDLTTYLKWLATLDIDYVIFQDYAVAQINAELGLGLKLHYNPESLVTSYGQFDFFVENKFSGCSLARELTLHEVETIAANKQQLMIEVQGFGFGLIMHSRWKLINNFDRFYHQSLNQATQPIWIKERLRKIPNLIFEDQHGTHLLTGYLINAIEYIQTLATAGVDLYLATFIKLDEHLAINVTKLLLSAFKALQTNSFDSKQILKDLEEIVTTKYLLSPGFLGNLAKLPHLEKDEVHE